MALQKKASVFETDLFAPLMAVIAGHNLTTNLKSARIVADHFRTAIFMLADGVIPTNTDRGYILRRLLRRAIFHIQDHKLDRVIITEIVEAVVNKYKPIYSDLETDKDSMVTEIALEVEKFTKTLTGGLKEFKKITTANISGSDAFKLFSTYGFPVEMTMELAKEQNKTVDLASFKEEFTLHQALSRQGGEQKFKGGLADTSDQTIKYHTATHLLHQALREVLGDHVKQKGSNITPLRLRFDFTHNQKLTEEEKKQVEDKVNEKITAGLPVNSVVLPKTEAEKTGALHFFGDKYGDSVNVYYIGDSLDTAYSKEFCGGPHVTNTSDLGKFKIKKEESTGEGIRRIKAVLE